MTSFVPNGLLGSGRNPDTDHASPAWSSVSAQAPQTGTFSNGLLGKSAVNEIDFISPANRADENLEYTREPSQSRAVATPPAAPSSFIPNGLLSVPSITRSENAADEIPTSSFDDSGFLPPVNEAFGIPAKPFPSKAGPSSTWDSTPLIIPVTDFGGKTFYWKRKIQRRNIIRRGIQPEKMGNLLDIPIHRLMEQLSTTKAMEIRENDRLPAVTVSPSSVEDTLWVDKYRPLKFTDLMGNERVARDAMGWVKQWDWCVFGVKQGRKHPRTGQVDEAYVDEYHRPREKLLLLSGPPGLGKTTLAHVIARQAGYEVMEINASDARSGSIIDDRIRPILESGSAVGSTRPVMLIIDEIDGATGAGDSSNTFIHKLISLTLDWPKKKRRKDHTTKRPILRPIICICNDANASSLMKLRPHTLHIRLQRPADIHTVKRLREICEIEGLKAEFRALTTLVGVAKGDLRGCLNTLQLIKLRNEEVSENIVRSATVGMKEADFSLTTILNNLFNPLSKKRVKELAMTEEEESRYVTRLSREIEGSGRENAIALGCFGHYVTLRQHDANFSRYEKANEWITVFDILSAGMYQNGDFTLAPYLPFTLVPFYPLFQERGGERVERNQQDWEHLQLARSNEEILKSVGRCLRSASSRLEGDFRHFLNSPALELEFMPFINRIISPPLRPVNSQVIRPEEKALLTRLVNIMTALELRFVQERAEDGQLSYRLDPPADVFITYDSKRATDISLSRYSVRHMVAKEIDALLIVRDADVVEKGARGKHESLGSRTSSKLFGQTDKTKEDIADNGFAKKRTRTDDIDIADKPPTDFFGRIILAPSAVSVQTTEKNLKKKSQVTYRFTEGNSAAVRKPVKVASFL